MNELITYEQYITASGKYPERLNSPELTDELKENARALLEKVNIILNEVGVHSVTVSSGFRPSNVNANIENAAPKSAHMLCQAIDIVDDKFQTIARLVFARQDLMIKHDLWQEDMRSTKGKNSNWLHLDVKPRSERPLRVFKP